MLHQIKIILIYGFILITCKTPARIGTTETQYNLMLPCRTGSDSFTSQSNSYSYYEDQNQSMINYAYYNHNSNLLFSYNYEKNQYKGTPFIYIFDYFYNDTFTLVCEVANPKNLNSRYFINMNEVYPDTNNLIFYKFKNATHAGHFDIEVTMHNKEFNSGKKQWLRKINLEDSSYFRKESMLEHGLWNIHIP